MALLEAVKCGNLAFVKKNIKDISVTDTKWIDYALLKEAIDSEQLKIAHFLICKNFRIYKPCTTRFQETPLHKAVLLKDLNLIKMLLKKGAPIDVKNKDGNTPLLLAAKQWTNSDGIDSIVKYLKVDKTSNIIDKHGISYMHIACMSSYTQIVEEMLKSNCDIDKQVKSSSPHWPDFTPLHFSVKYGVVKTVQLLLSKGADINIVDANQDTPLHLAFREQNQIIVKNILLSARTKIDNLVNTEGISHFHIACSQNFSIVKRFLLQNIDIDCKIFDSSTFFPGSTALHIAITFGCDKVVKELLANNASFTIKDNSGSTPLHIAFYKKNNAFVDLILSTIDRCENPADGNGLTHFHIACSRDNAKIVEKFIVNEVQVDSPTGNNFKLLPSCTPLHIATFYQRLENIKLLLFKKANVNLQNAEGQIPLHLICRGSDESLLTIKKSMICYLNSDEDKNLDFVLSKINLFTIISLLLDYKSNVNIKDNLGKIPLFYLYDKHYHDKLFKMLNGLVWFYDIKRAAIIQHLLQIRRTVIFTMLQYSVNLSISDINGCSIMHYLANDEQEFQSSENQMIKLFIHHQACVNAKNNKNQTPLLLAIRKNYFYFVEIILQRVKDVDVAESETLSTPIHELIKYWNGDHNESGKNRKYSSILSLLVHKGANINSQDHLGNTPLHYVTNTIVLGQLLNYGADINIKNNNGNTPTSLRLSHLKLSYAGHMIKLKEIGYSFIQENEDFLNSIKKGMYFRLPAQQEYLDELERLKLVNIDIYTTMYNILFKSSQQMIHYLNNTNLKELLFERKYLHDEFPIYESIMRLQYRNGQLREPLVKPAIGTLQVLSYSKLTNICCEIIMEYLSNEELRDLIKTKHLIDCDKINAKQQIPIKEQLKLDNGKRVKLN